MSRPGGGWRERKEEEEVEEGRAGGEGERRTGEFT